MYDDNLFIITKWVIVMTCLVLFVVSAAATGADIINYKKFKLKPAARKLLYKAMLTQIIIAGVAFFSLFLNGGHAPNMVPHAPIDQQKALDSPPDVLLRVNADETVLGLPDAPTSDAPKKTIAAGPVLHGAGISLRDISPPNSHIVIKNNIALYSGRAVSPKVSQNILMQENDGGDPSDTSGSFTLVFDNPVTSVSFVRPALFPETDSGVTHPAWSAHALDEHGKELASYSEGLIRAFKPNDVPAQTVTLRAPAPAFGQIAAVRFDSDYRLNGKPFAGFFSVLIERLTWTRLERVGTYAPPN